MSTVRELHDQAMRIAQEALLAREEGASHKAISLAQDALKLEVAAAQKIDVSPENEPTRAILYKSAASLALQSQQYEQAERLVAEGLLGFPPPDVRLELGALYEQIRFEWGLQTNDLVLSGEEINLTLKGESVGYGQILYKDLRKRIDALVSLIDRTSRRFQAQPYQRSGPAPKTLHQFQTVIGVPRAGSFSVTLGLASMSQTNLSLFTDQHAIISSVVTGVNLIQQGNERTLRESINDDAYYRHFVTAARSLAPDGEMVTRVSIDTRDESVDFTRIRRDLTLPIDTTDANQEVLTSPQRETMTGTLVAADARKQGVIGLETDHGFFSLFVPEGLDELVKSYFNSLVSVEVHADHEKMSVIDVQEIED